MPTCRHFVVCNQAGGAELARYDLSEDAAIETAMLFGAARTTAMASERTGAVVRGRTRKEG